MQQLHWRSGRHKLHRTRHWCSPLPFVQPGTGQLAAGAPAALAPQCGNAAGILTGTAGRQHLEAPATPRTKSGGKGPGPVTGAPLPKMPHVHQSLTGQAMPPQTTGVPHLIGATADV